MATRHRPFTGWTGTYLASRLRLARSRLHDELEILLDSLRTKRGTHRNILAPRGSAKTTWSTFSYPAYAALEGFEPHIVLAADSGEQAEDYVNDIGSQLEENELIRRDYWPAIRGAKVKSGRIELPNGVLIRAGSTGKKIRGRKHRGYRPSLIVIDDPQNLDHIISEKMRQRSIQWLMKDVMEAGDPDTNVLMLGTALHRECLVCHLATLWDTVTYRAIEEYPARMDLWENQWRDLLFNYDNKNRFDVARKFYDDNRAAMDAGSAVLWEAREPLYTLMLKRALNGVAAFNSEKQNDPIDPSLCEWPAEYFNWPGLWFDEWPADTLVHRVLSIDPSKGGESKPGDYSAIVMDGLDPMGRQFVEADVSRRSIETICADACKHVRRFKPECVVIETNQFQDLIKPILKATAAALDVKLPRIVDCENRENKALRIRRVGPDLASKSVRFKRNSPGTTLLIQQLQDFPHGGHDDGADAWEMARRQIKGKSGWVDP